MGFLQTRRHKLVTVYLPLAIFLFVLLFPFYWMAVTSVKPDNELLSRDGNPFWVIKPTLAHFHKLLFETAYPEWLWNTVLVSVVATAFSLFASVLAAYAIERDGSVRWRFETGADVDAPLTMLRDGSLVVASEDGTITMLLP